MARRIPRSLYPHGAEQEYYRALLNAIKTWFDSLKQSLSAQVRRDDFESTFDSASKLWAALSATLGHAVSDAAKKVIRTVERSFGRQQQAALANTTQSITFRVGFVPFGQYQGELDAFTRQNALLIKDIGDKAARDIEILVQDAVSRGAQTRDLAKILKEQFGYTKRRAAVIARDQIGKLNGNLQRIRMQEAGVDRYQWQTMEDRRVRPKHVHLNQTIRTWDQSPTPGSEIMCRCVPLPLFE